MCRCLAIDVASVSLLFTFIYLFVLFKTERLQSIGEHLCLFFVFIFIYLSLKNNTPPFSQSVHLFISVFIYYFFISLEM